MSLIKVLLIGFISTPIFAQTASLKGLPVLTSSAIVETAQVGQAVYDESFQSWDVVGESRDGFEGNDKKVNLACEAKMAAELAILNSDLENKNLEAIPYGQPCSLWEEVNESNGAIELKGRLNQKVIIVKK